MELSIIVAVYNMAEDVRLEYCLNSLLNQTISDYEIIVVDDASTDNTSQILLDFAAHYPDVLKVYLAREHEGRGAARNKALKQASGKWVGFVESWDWIAPDMYEKLLRCAKETGADMVACDYHLALENSKDIGEIVHAHSEEQTGLLDVEKYKELMLDFGGFCNKIYRRKVILDCGMTFPERMYFDDESMECAIALRAKHFEYVPEPLYASCEQYRMADVQEYCLDQMNGARIMRQHAQDFGRMTNYRDEIEFKFIENFYIRPMLTYLKEAEHRDPDFLRILLREMKGTFPDFMENPYYKERITPEVAKMIRLHQKSTRLLLSCYDIQSFARHLGKGGWKNFCMNMAGITLGVVLCLALADVICQDKKPLEYPIVLLGDSIVANDYEGDELNEILSRALGEPVFNGGFGGSHLANHNEKGYESHGEEALSMEELADSIVTGDFVVQQSVIQKISKLEYYEDRLAELSQIDFDAAHTLIIEHGINDYASQIPPEGFEESLRNIITELQTRYPKLQIWVSSPVYCYIIRDGERLYCDETAFGIYVLEDYVLTEQRVCQELGVGFVDNYHGSRINQETVESYTIDGMHLNEAGRYLLAENILKAMKH